MKTPEGLAHIMSVIAEEDTNASAYVASLRSSLLSAHPLPPAPAEMPALAPTIQVGSVAANYNNLSTKVKLQSILKNKK